MKEYKKEEAISLMNAYGKESQPFLFMIDYKEQRIRLAKLDEINSNQLLYDFNGFTNVEREKLIKYLDSSLNKDSIVWKPVYPSLEEYTRSFDIVSRHIQAGNSYLVNLTNATQVKTNLSLLDVFYHSNALYKCWVKEEFVVFSPEIFVRMKDNHIFSYPMKGTIDAAIPMAREMILNDPKEAAEHATIVDLIRNDLSQIATEVCVPRYRYIDELRTHRGRLYQVSSEIRGRLPNNWKAQIGEFLFRLLPAGSITGAPKKKTLEIIAQAETYERGFYTGVMGYFDGKQVDSAVMIRFMEQQSGQSFIFKSGGGITSKSDLKAEYNELKQKVYVPIY